MINKKQLIIFDFDGVLADSFETFYQLIKAGMKKIGISLTRGQYRELFMGNIHQGFKDFIKSQEKYKIFSEFRTANYNKYYYSKKHKISLFPGTVEFLKKVTAKYILTIASSGKQKNIENLLKTKNIDSLFELILANSDQTKEGMIKEILNKFQSKPQKTIMITDTVGDLKIAKNIGLKTIAVTWGFHSPKLLKTAKPDYVVNNLKKLEQILR